MNTSVNLIDVGARDGIHQRWAPFHPLMNVVAFEPDVEECARLNASEFPYRSKYLPVALGERDGENATLYLTKQPGCSSLYRPNAALLQDFEYGEQLEVVRSVPLMLSTMDSACTDFSPHAMKLDTQGTELSILRGATRLLQSTIAVELEVEFAPMYEGQPLFADVDSFMCSQGFTLWSLRRTYWRYGQPSLHAYGGRLVHGDALYLREDLFNSPEGHVILAAYKQYDLLERLGAQHLIPRRSASTGFLARALQRFENHRLRAAIDKVRPACATDWHDPDFF